MYKLVAFDLDGTLLNDDKTIDEDVIEALDFLLSKDVEIVIATGRAYISAKELTAQINPDVNLLYASNNGNVIRRRHNDELLFENILEPKYAKELIVEGDKIGIEPMLHVNKFEDGYDVIVRKDNPVLKGDTDHMLFRTKEVDEFSDEDLEHILSMAFFGPEEKTKELFRLKGNNEDKYNSHIMETVMTAESLVEFMGKDGNKWNAIMMYANSVGIKPEEIITFGDDNNDIEMVKNSGLGVAMLNANDGVKEIADRITEEDNNNLGISKKLDRIFNIGLYN